MRAWPSGWVYEGWAVTQWTALPTGRFTDAAAADLGRPYSDSGPPLPGEDSLMKLSQSITTLVDASKIVSSVEPDIAGTEPTGDGPSKLEPLAIDRPAGRLAETSARLGPLLQPSAPLDKDHIYSAPWRARVQGRRAPPGLEPGARRVSPG